MSKKKLIIANWKLNPESPREARELFVPVRRAASKASGVEVVVCPPAVFLPVLAAYKSAKNVALGGQDAYWEPVGAYTGAVSAVMLKKSGASYVIVGHSESRVRQLADGDTDEIVNLKARAALATGLRVVLCVGERERDAHGEYLHVIRQQLLVALRGVSKKYFSSLVIAYEPVWAIGVDARGSDTPEEFLAQALYIKKVLSSLAGQELAMSVPVLYGGSVTPENAGSFLTAGQADGLLVGRASLRADHFSEIIRVSAGA